MFTLHERDRTGRAPAQGLICDEDGLHVGNDCTLIAREQIGLGRYRVREPEEINRNLSKTYGFQVNLADRLRALDRIAKLMSDGHWDLARISALHLRLPDIAANRPGPDRLAKFNQNHKPAGPGGGQFTSGPSSNAEQAPASFSGDKGSRPGVPRLSFKTTAGSANTPFWGTQFFLSSQSKLGGYIIQRIDTTYVYSPTLSNQVAPFWEAFEVKLGSNTTNYPHAIVVGHGDDVWEGEPGDESGNHGVQIDTGTARFYEGLTADQLKAHGFAWANSRVGSVGGAHQYNTDTDPHLPTERASNIVVRTSKNKF